MRIGPPSSRRLVLVVALLAICVLRGSQLPGHETNPRSDRANALTILSIPSGLEVYFGPDSEQPASSEDGFVPLEAKHALITKGSLKGVTPVTLGNVKAGRYLVGIAPVTILDRNYRRGPADTSMEIRGAVTFTPMPATPGALKADIKGAVIYSVTLSGAGPHRVIVVNAPKNADLATLNSLYPANASFDFDAAAFTAEMTERSSGLFSAEEGRQVVDLLRRGGKVFVQKGDIRFVAEINPDGTWDMSTEARVPQE